MRGGRSAAAAGVSLQTSTAITLTFQIADQDMLSEGFGGFPLAMQTLGQQNGTAPCLVRQAWGCQCDLGTPYRPEVTLLSANGGWLS